MSNSNNTTRLMSWNTHSLISRFSLCEYFSKNEFEKVAVSPLDKFISKCRDRLLEFSLVFHKDLYNRLGLGHPDGRKVESLETIGDFIRIFRLNPQTQFHHVRVYRLEELSPGTGHDVSREGPPGHSYIPVEVGAEIPVFEIICAYSDEPDWGMDQNIFSVREYGLANPPFGPVKGMSSQAPFHMGFPHESRLAYWIVPSLGRSLVSTRVRMCLGLSEIAFAQGMDYWGWRFAAWAAHYLQDITCPVHCMPIPVAPKALIVNLMMNPSPTKFFKKCRDLFRNRHGLFEASVCYLMNKSVKQDSDRRLIDVLLFASDGLDANVDSVIRSASETPHNLAPKIIDFLVNLYSYPVVDQPERYVNPEGEFLINGLLEEAITKRPQFYDGFVDSVCKCLEQAGRVTRFVIVTSRRGAQHDSW